ncbi:MAG: hypothetical protein GXX83_02755 [Gaiellales bacterium]|nr:hypothetical protein [Gaiellales bacterium]
MNEDGHISPQDFGAFAGHDLELWRILEGSEALLEDGRIGPVRPVYEVNGQIRLQVRFTNLYGSGEVQWYSINDLVRGCEVVGFRLETAAWNQVREASKRRSDEAWAKGHFRLLRAKYFVGRWDNQSPLSELYTVLLKLEDRASLSQSELEWLEGTRLDSVMAAYYDQRFDQEGQPWHVLLASSHWRDAGLPHLALRASARISGADPHLMAAILRTRGGAHRDLGSLDDAEQLVLQSLEIEPDSLHGYSLLGAVRYQQGRPDEGEDAFERAVALGAHPESQEQSRRKALREAEPIARSRIASFLLDRDPLRYSWAAAYLDE